MANGNSVWRPRLFGATGTGFVGDPQLQDGLHLRWHLDHRLGLPTEIEGQRSGVFSLSFQRFRPGTLATIDLFDPALSSAYPVHDSNVVSQQAGLTGGTNQLGFWQGSDAAQVSLFSHCEGQLRAAKHREWTWNEQQFSLRDYSAALVNGLRPDLLDSSLTREHAEACAVDLRFDGIIGGAPSTSGRRYVNIDGLDHSGRRVAQDWVGLEPSGAPRTTARLRAAGLAEVKWQPVPAEPPVVLDRTRWILCQDYCRAPLWLNPVDEIWFRADPGFHTPEVVELQHYAPFHHGIDSVLASEAIAGQLLSDPEMHKLFAQLPDTETMAAHRVGFDEASDADGGKMQLSLLQSLIAAGFDPVMARVLGLYAYLGTGGNDFEGNDIRIEAELPFFAAANLATLDQRLQGLRPGASPTFFLDTAQTLGGLRLSALIIAPTVGPKDPLPPPSGLSGNINVIDLPAQGIDDQIELVVQARLEVPIDGYETRPEQTPIAYAVERSVSNGAYINVADSGGDQDFLDQIGLLPAVYFPLRDYADPTQALLKIADDFALPALSTESVRYRLRAYDVFGRASSAVEGPDQPIVPPCKPPAVPLNPAARVYPDNGLLMLELNFAVNGTSQPLEAQWQQLEVTLHRLPEPNPELPDPRPPAEVDWTGKLPARRLLLDFLPGHTLQNAIAQSCVELEWVPQLQATAAGADQCATLYPPPVPELLAFDPASMPFAETGLRSYQLRVVLGSSNTLAADRYRWCARLRILGHCTLSGAALGSPEVCAAADWLVPPLPPEPITPITSLIPLSSYSDTLGDAWYDLDLSGHGLGDGDLVNVYMARLERLGASAGELVADGMLLDQVAFQGLARASRGPYELLTAAPFEYHAQTPFYRIRVDGALRQVYAVAVVGCNPYLQEQPWSRAACSLFTTPAPVPPPLLRFEYMQPFIDANRPALRLAYQAEFNNPPELAHPPKLQLFRRDLSSGTPTPRYIGEAIGTLQPADDGGPAGETTLTHYRFELADLAQDDWRRYQYQAVLVSYVPARGVYLKNRDPVHNVAQAGWGQTRSPFKADDRIAVKAAATQGLEVSADFDCGELDFVLTRTLDGRITGRFEGRLREGRLYGLADDAYTLELAPGGSRQRYRLTVHDVDAQTAPVGHYVLRLSYGQQMTWSNRENIAS